MSDQTGEASWAVGVVSIDGEELVCVSANDSRAMLSIQMAQLMAASLLLAVDTLKRLDDEQEQ